MYVADNLSFSLSTEPDRDVCYLSLFDDSGTADCYVSVWQLFSLEVSLSTLNLEEVFTVVTVI